MHSQSESKEKVSALTVGIKGEGKCTHSGIKGEGKCTHSGIKGEGIMTLTAEGGGHSKCTYVFSQWKLKVHLD